MGAYMNVGKVGTVSVALDARDGTIRIMDLSVDGTEAQVEIPANQVAAVVEMIVRAFKVSAFG